MSTLTFAALLGAGVLAMLPARAHHALVVQYHVDREITIEGVVEHRALSNPHVRIHLLVDGDEPWIAEGSPHTTLLRAGWTGAEIESGALLKVVGHPARDGSNIVLWRRLYLADGREVWGKHVDSP